MREYVFQYVSVLQEMQLDLLQTGGSCAKMNSFMLFCCIVLHPKDKYCIFFVSTFTSTFQMAVFVRFFIPFLSSKYFQMR